MALAAEAHDSETRLAGFVMGTNDLAKETRARLVPGRAPMLPWLATCVLAAHAHGIDILDGVYNDIGDAEGFEAECAQARDMGFDGKTLIHPNQIEPCNTAFSPSADEVAQARKMIAAFDLPENRDKGVVQIDGRMVERMHAEMARPHGGDRRGDRRRDATRAADLMVRLITAARIFASATTFFQLRDRDATSVRISSGELGRTSRPILRSALVDLRRSASAARTAALSRSRSAPACPRARQADPGAHVVARHASGDRRDVRQAPPSRRRW